jgi:hypothetical protein
MERAVKTRERGLLRFDGFELRICFGFPVSNFHFLHIAQDARMQFPRPESAVRFIPCGLRRFWPLYSGMA